MPPGLFAQGVNLPDDWQIMASNSATYGEWPNGRDSKVVKANASLLGAHRVASTYAPEINFTLADDFMPALQARSASLPSGASRLDWNALPKATGYYAWAIGAKSGGGGNPDMVWWSSQAPSSSAARWPVGYLPRRSPNWLQRTPLCRDPNELHDPCRG